MTTALEGGEGSASRPGLSLLPGNIRYPLYRRLGGPQGRSGHVRKISPPPRSPDRPVLSQSLYRLSYPAHRQSIRLCIKQKVCLVPVADQFGFIQLFHPFRHSQMSFRLLSDTICCQRFILHCLHNFHFVFLHTPDKVYIFSRIPSIRSKCPNISKPFFSYYCFLTNHLIPLIFV